MEIKNQKDYFNDQYKNWLNTVDENKIKIMDKSIKQLNINKNHKVLDVACGTGVLYPLLMNIPVKKYTGLDISEKMLEEFSKEYNDAETKLGDFDKQIKLEEMYDIIIIFNSIPHFENLDVVFENSRNNLKQDGKLSIVHGRTRRGLTEHHNKIGYNLGRDAIPKDDVLEKLCNDYGFEIEEIMDEEFFFFSCRKLISD
ncbi:methyltransferase domain-containing protein [Clostridium sediminicola]|uniref:class I SAM-dependent DNA methyltransferase n=1 Tax=Clostridium sediminicola TaxID=3114879 RepID=UPI0031F1DA83